MTSQTHHNDLPLGVLFEGVVFRVVPCLLVHEYLKIKHKRGQVAFIECVYSGTYLKSILPLSTRRFSLYPKV